MKSNKFPLIIAGAVILFAVLGILIINSDNDGEEQDAPEDVFVLDTALLQARLDSAASALAADTAQPQAAALPTLKIGGKNDPDVYLQSLDINVEVTGNIASTRYTMVFKNKTNRILEGELTFPLPDGRTVTHYALDVNGRLREAVPVEKARATQVFEEIQQRVEVVDPGVLERVEGNNFRTRIYPFPAWGTRTISIGYEEELTLENGLLYYRLPMAYHNPIEKFAVKATVWKSGQSPLVPESGGEIRFDNVGGNHIASFSRENYSGVGALMFALPVPVNIPQVMMQSAQGSHYFLASVAPNIKARKKQWSDHLAIVWDVSLSGSQRDLKRELEALDIIFADRKDVSVFLYFLNNRLRRIVNKDTKNGEYKIVNGNWDELKKVLETAVYDGGTDFSQLKRLGHIVGREILLFSDGLSTLSDADFTDPGFKIGGINIIDTRPIHAIVSSPKADYSVMRLISGKTAGKFVNLNALSSQQLKNELLNETPLFLGARHGAGIREAYPNLLTPVHGNFSIAGIADSGETELTLLFGFYDSTVQRVDMKLDAKSADTLGNIYRIWAQKKIAEFDLDHAGNRVELAALGAQFGIVTRNTSLIVLEDINDYVCFNIEPPASEPVMFAEYRRRQAGRFERRRNVGRDMLNKSVGSAQSIARWWEVRGAAGSSEPPLYKGPDSAGIAAGGAAAITDEFVTNIDSLLSIVGVGEDSFGAGCGVMTRGGIGGFGGFAGDIDALLAGVGGLRAGGDGGVGRRGIAGMGFGSGYGSGFGGGGGGIDHLAGLMDGGPNLNLSRKSGGPRTSSPEFLKGGALTGGRSRASIQRIVIQNMAALRHAYNKRLREDQRFPAGRVTVKFAINEFGDVTFARVSESEICNLDFEKTVVSIVANWKFDRIDKPGDITEVTYPFMFADGLTNDRAPCASTASAGASGATLRSRERAVTSANVNDSASRARAARELERSQERASAQERARARRVDSLARIADSIARITIEKPYMKNLTGTLADDYQTYLMLRTDHANLPTFYFDMADWFHRNNDKETALQILTSIAELEIENASLYRLLGYRLKEYGEHALQEFIAQKVLQWRPMEPQSYRDYALALADNGRHQEALDMLYYLLTKAYSTNIGRRSDGIEEAVIMEMNRLIARNPKLNISKIDKRLIMKIPVDIRVVLNWNLNNVDMDLHVIDPRGEDAYYGNRTTRAGGRMSVGNRSGYGPEQFILKNAPRGKYRVYAAHYDSREFAETGPSTVMAEIYTNYASEPEQRQVVTLQLSRAGARRTGGKALVAEFDF